MDQNDKQDLKKNINQRHPAPRHTHLKAQETIANKMQYQHIDLLGGMALIHGLKKMELNHVKRNMNLRFGNPNNYVNINKLDTSDMGSNNDINKSLNLSPLTSICWHNQTTT